MKNMNSKNHYQELIKKSSSLQAAIEDAQLSIDISMQISKLRNNLGLTQKELAILADIQQSNISRLESPGYQAYTLKVLSKVVRALGAKLRVEIVKPITSTNRHSFYSENRHISSLKAETVISNKWVEDKETVKELINV
jgi:transcriptional regulator with XRE-family HTH domain